MSSTQPPKLEDTCMQNILETANSVISWPRNCEFLGVGYKNVKEQTQVEFLYSLTLTPQSGMHRL
jgi:hypothetical protein